MHGLSSHYHEKGPVKKDIKRPDNWLFTYSLLIVRILIRVFIINNLRY